MTWLLALLLSPAFATGLQDSQVQYTHQVLRSSNTCDTVSISSQPATEIVRSSVTFFTQIHVQNFDSGKQVWCSDSVDVSTLTTSNLAGVKIGTTGLDTDKITFPLVPGQLWYCINDGVTGIVRASICRRR